MKQLTPPDLPVGVTVRKLEIPASKEWLGIFNSALLTLVHSWVYEQVYDTDLTPEVVADKCREIFDKYLISTDTPETMPTPFWDDTVDVDDEEPTDTQVWYGEVSSFLAPIDDLDFAQNAAIWGITGFVAYAAGIAPAIAFRTVARNFVLAVQREDVGEAIRVVVNGVQETRVDTTPYAVGEIIEVPIAVETEAAFYDITIIGGGTPP